MIQIASQAPEFRLPDQFGRSLSLADQRNKRHVLLLFYPADFTPT